MGLISFDNSSQNDQTSFKEIVRWIDGTEDLSIAGKTIKCYEAEWIEYHKAWDRIYPRLNEVPKKFGDYRVNEITTQKQKDGKKVGIKWKSKDHAFNWRIAKSDYDWPCRLRKPVRFASLSF